MYARWFSRSYEPGGIWSTRPCLATTKDRGVDRAPSIFCGPSSATNQHPRDAMVRATAQAGRSASNKSPTSFNRPPIPGLEQDVGPQVPPARGPSAKNRRRETLIALLPIVGQCPQPQHPFAVPSESLARLRKGHLRDQVTPTGLVQLQYESLARRQAAAQRMGQMKLLPHKRHRHDELKACGFGRRRMPDPDCSAALRGGSERGPSMPSNEDGKRWRQIYRPGRQAVISSKALE